MWFICYIMGITRTNPQLKELLNGINSIPASITLYTFLRFSFIQRWNDNGAKQLFINKVPDSRFNCVNISLQFMKFDKILILWLATSSVKCTNNIWPTYPPRLL